MLVGLDKTILKDFFFDKIADSRIFKPVFVKKFKDVYDGNILVFSIDYQSLLYLI